MELFLTNPAEKWGGGRCFLRHCNCSRKKGPHITPRPGCYKKVLKKPCLLNQLKCRLSLILVRIVLVKTFLMLIDSFGATNNRILPDIGSRTYQSSNRTTWWVASAPRRNKNENWPANVRLKQKLAFRGLTCSNFSSLSETCCCLKINN